jgi:hypothetical protein
VPKQAFFSETHFPCGNECEGHDYFLTEEEQNAADLATWREKIASVGFTKSISWRRGKQRTKGF